MIEANFAAFPHPLQHLDSDNDGKLTMGELSRHTDIPKVPGTVDHSWLPGGYADAGTSEQKSLFAFADKDGDGSLDFGEYLRLTHPTLVAREAYYELQLGKFLKIKDANQVRARATSVLSGSCSTDR
jgi:hypothetical protein